MYQKLDAEHKGTTRRPLYRSPAQSENNSLTPSYVIALTSARMCSRSCVHLSAFISLHAFTHSETRRQRTHDTYILYSQIIIIYIRAFRMLAVINKSLFNTTGGNSYVIFIISIYCRIACIACVNPSTYAFLPANLKQVAIWR